jgi:hypothetical protein
MRVILLLVPLLLCATRLAAQPAQAPAPDAPVPRHVAHLLELARTGFVDVRGAPAAPLDPWATTRVFGSSYRMRFYGQEVRSELRVQEGREVRHFTRFPVAGGRAAADSLLTLVAREVGTVTPAGWQQMVSQGLWRSVTPAGWQQMPSQDPWRSVAWWECLFGGRKVELETTLPGEQPGLNLVVSWSARPCPSGASQAPRR